MILSVILVLLFNILEFVKYKVLNIDFNVIFYIIKFVSYILILIINNKKFKKYSFLNKMINWILIVMSILHVISNSANVYGLLFLYLFILLISFVFYCATNLKFEVSIPISVSILILFFVLLGLLNLLKYSYLFLIIIIIACVIYLFKNKSSIKKKALSISKISFILFSVLFLIAILTGLGRYVHKWDEYSYWAYAAKVLINTSSITKMVSSVASMNTYPPVSSVWHYIVSLFLGYSEPNLYIGLTLLSFIFLMPIFMKIKEKNVFSIIVFSIIATAFPYLFNGSYSYWVLYVDLLLGYMCLCSLILEEYLRENRKTFVPLYILLIVITLLKPNGFVFSSCLLFLFFLKSFSKEKFNIKLLLKELKKYIIPVILVLFIFASWMFISKGISNENYSYIYKLMPESLKTDLSLKLNYQFLLNYVNSLISSVDESIIYSFINIPLFAFLIIVLSIISIIDKKEKNYKLYQSLLPYVIFYITFFGITALSLFVMFSYYEASELASFARYLTPINVALFGFCLYKSSYLFTNNSLTKVLYASIVILIGFNNCTFFITDIKARRETYTTSESRNNIFSVINNNTSEKSKIFVINQEDTESIMPLWYARYYCYPRIINANNNAITWKIETASNEWDLKGWGLTKEKLIKHIIDYDFDYVFLYSSTDELYDALEENFDDITLAKKSKLFKVEKNDQSKIKLISVK